MDREFFKKSYFSLFSTSIVYYYFRVLILPSRAVRKLQCMYICNDSGCIFHMHPCCICMYICDVHAELTHCFLTTIRITKKKKSCIVAYVRVSVGEVGLLQQLFFRNEITSIKSIQWVTDTRKGC